MGKQSGYATGSIHEFMAAIRREVVNLGGDDTDMKRVHTDPELAISIAAVIVYVERVAPRDLTDIIRYAPNPEVRLRALPCLSDVAKHQAFLQRVVYDDADPRVRLAAAKLITVEMILTEIALRTEDLKVGYEVVGRIRDESALAQITLRNSPHTPTAEILMRLEGKVEHLCTIATDHQNESIALDALARMHDPERLEAICGDAKCGAVRKKAGQRLRLRHFD